MAQNKIMIVDDNAEIRQIVDVLLSSEGCEVIEAVDGYDALTKLNDEIDVIILDIMMPGMDGFETCQEIRKTSNVPILFLTAKGQDRDKTLGFTSGGDDYLAKPFSYSELTARVQALLRRYTIYRGKSNHETKEINIDNLRINPENQQVYLDDKLVDLTDIEYQILYLLASHRKEVYSLERLYQAIWEEPYYYSANNTVMVHIGNLRKKIEKDTQNPRFIKTVWGRGYRCD